MKAVNRIPREVKKAMRIRIIARKPKACQIDDENCRECQTPCKSAAKTSNTISNQTCEAKGVKTPWIL